MEVVGAIFPPTQIPWLKLPKTLKYISMKFGVEEVVVVVLIYSRKKWLQYTIEANKIMKFTIL